MNIIIIYYSIPQQRVHATSDKVVLLRNTNRKYRVGIRKKTREGIKKQSFLIRLLILLPRKIN